jgi:hypothetical protein
VHSAVERLRHRSEAETSRRCGAAVGRERFSDFFGFLEWPEWVLVRC